MDVKERIKLLMKEKDWSEYRLAKEAKLPQSTISHLFKRNNAPTYPTIEAICKAFGNVYILLIKRLRNINYKNILGNFFIIFRISFCSAVSFAFSVVIISIGTCSYATSTGTGAPNTGFCKFTDSSKKAKL